MCPYAIALRGKGWSDEWNGPLIVKARSGLNLMEVWYGVSKEEKQRHMALV